MTGLIPVAVLPGTGIVYRQMDDGAWYPLDVTGTAALHDCDAAALVRYAPAEDTAVPAASTRQFVSDQQPHPGAAPGSYPSGGLGRS